MSSTMPANPMTSPAIVPRFGRTPFDPAHARSAIHIGIVATISAAIPEGRRCSDHVTVPLLTQRSATPMIAVDLHSIAVGLAAVPWLPQGRPNPFVGLVPISPAVAGAAPRAWAKEKKRPPAVRRGFPAM